MGLISYHLESVQLILTRNTDVKSCDNGWSHSACSRWTLVQQSAIFNNLAASHVSPGQFCSHNRLLMTPSFGNEGIQNGCCLSMTINNIKFIRAIRSLLAISKTGNWGSSSDYSSQPTNQLLAYLLSARLQYGSQRSSVFWQLSLAGSNFLLSCVDVKLFLTAGKRGVIIGCQVNHARDSLAHLRLSSWWNTDEMTNLGPLCLGRFSRSSVVNGLFAGKW